MHQVSENSCKRYEKNQRRRTVLYEDITATFDHQSLERSPEKIAECTKDSGDA